MFKVACGALTGVCCVLLAPRLPTYSELAVAAVLLATLSWRLRSGAIAACVLAGTVTTLDAGARMADWLSPELETARLTITGTVSSVPQSRPDGTRFEFEPDRKGGIDQPGRIQLTWYDATTQPRAAERWTLDVKLRRPRGFANPGGSDLAARLLRDRIGATGYVRSGHRLPIERWDFCRRPVLRVRAHIADSIRAALGERPSAGIVTGLAVGLQDALSTEQWNALSRTGTSHLMAISGLHIGMVAAIVAWIAARLQRARLRSGAIGTSRDAAVVAGSLAALLYALLAGASVPTQRTLLMIAIGAFALHRRRNSGVADGLSITLIAVLIIDPLAPLAPGFWLSFGAVGVICASLGGHVLRQGLLSVYLRTQLAVTIGLVPVLAGAFGSVSLVSVPVNLIAIPLYTLVVVPAVLLGAALAALHLSPGEQLLRAVAWLIDVSWPLIATPASWALASWHVTLDGPWGWVALICGAVAALAPLQGHARAAACAIVVVCCCWRAPPPADGRAHVAVLDVGQGLAVVVQTHRRALVYDTGPSFRSGSDAAQLVVLPYLRQRGISSIDVLAISHDDDDHAGGAPTLLESMPVRSVYASRHDLAPGVPTRRCVAGETWTWDGVRFAWLNPAPEPGDSDNDSSCVLLIDAAGQALLLPGDIEARGESRVVDRLHAGGVDVVVVPHHGSRTSSSQEFVAVTRPRWALVSAGYLNRWGMPRPDIVDRWQLAGAQVLTTADTGAMQFELGAGRVAEPNSYRRDNRRFWHDR